MKYIVYKIVSKTGEVEYVGQTTDLQKRIYQHLCADGGKLKDENLSRFWGVTFTEFDSQSDMDFVEMYLIAKLKPRLNIKHLGLTHTLNYDVNLDNLVWINVPIQLFRRRSITSAADDLYFHSYGFEKHEAIKDFPIYYHKELPTVSVYKDGDFYRLIRATYTSLKGLPYKYLAGNTEEVIALEDVRSLGTGVYKDIEELDVNIAQEDIISEASIYANEVELPTYSGVFSLMIKEMINSHVNKHKVSLAEAEL